MPTIDQFEYAASLFDSAADQVQGLTMAAEGTDANLILLGGSLGKRVPERIASASDLSRWCHARLSFMAKTCRARAVIVAEYAAALEQYALDYERYRHEAVWWIEEFDAWWNDPYGMPYPSTVEPVEPEPPIRPFDWIET